jgi:hypothetical protein
MHLTTRERFEAACNAFTGSIDNVRVELGKP